MGYNIPPYPYERPPNLNRPPIGIRNELAVRGPQPSRLAHGAASRRDRLPKLRSTRAQAALPRPALWSLDLQPV